MVALAYCSAMDRHKSKSHPERPERILAAYAELCHRGLVEKCDPLTVRRARLEELCECHDPLYVHATLGLRREDTDDEYLRMLSRKQNSVYLTPFTVDCALLSAGAVIEATRAVTGRKAKNSVALCRPPGHHALGCCMMGFCLFNNVAVAAADALKANPAMKIMIIE